LRCAKGAVVSAEDAGNASTLHEVVVVSAIALKPSSLESTYIMVHLGRAAIGAQ